MGKGAMMSASKNLGVVSVSSIETEIAADGEIFRNAVGLDAFA